MNFKIGDKVRFWCDNYKHLLNQPAFYSYGTILMIHPSDFERYPYFIKWEGLYNGLGTSAWWGRGQGTLELVPESNDVLKAMLWV